MRLRLGRVRYINCEPVYHAIEHGQVSVDCAIADGTPAELNARLRAGDLDISVVSVMEAALRPDAYYLLPDLAIACDGPVDSVLLASRRPPDELSGRLVALTRHSLTSVYLVKLLLEKAYHVRPRYTEGDADADADARLVIGDEALRLGPRFPHSVDLGKAWYTFTGLPFVFAVWAVRQEVWQSAPTEVLAIHHALQTSKAYTRAHPEAMLALAQERVGLPAEACERYLRERLCFDLGPRHLEGLHTFLKMLTEVGTLRALPSLRFIAGR